MTTSNAEAERTPSSTTRLDPTAGHLTLINTYDVEPARMDELVAFLVHATHTTIKHVPGFVSANLHVSHDRTRLVNYAQWKSPDAIAAARNNSEAAALMDQQMRIAQGFTPVPYDLKVSIGAPDAP